MVSRDDTVKGYAVVRACEEGYKIGPLFADDHATALQLFASAMKSCEGVNLHLDVPADQTAFLGILRDNGFERGFETTRMYHGAAPEIEQPGIFAVTSLELG